MRRVQIDLGPTLTWGTSTLSERCGLRELGPGDFGTRRRRLISAGTGLAEPEKINQKRGPWTKKGRPLRPPFSITRALAERLF